MSKLVSTFSIHHAQYTLLRLDKKITIGHFRSRSRNYDSHIVSFLFTIYNQFYNENMSISYTINHFMVLET